MVIPNHSIETFSGAFVDTANPDPATICLEDIAHALASICRFGGHSKKFYPVAEHAVFCSFDAEANGASRDECLAVLHHDDSETFLGDVTRPLKPLLGHAYSELTDKMDKAIIAALNLPFTASALHSSFVKEIDTKALMLEAQELMRSRGAHWFDGDVYYNTHGTREDIALPPYWTGGLEPAQAEGLYLSRHWELI